MYKYSYPTHMYETLSLSFSFSFEISLKLYFLALQNLKKLCIWVSLIVNESNKKKTIIEIIMEH